MAQLNHKQKKRLARKMRTSQEQSDRIPIFDSKAWRARKEARTGIKDNRPTIIVRDPKSGKAKPLLLDKVKGLFSGSKSKNIKSNRATLPQKVV